MGAHAAESDIVMMFTLRAAGNPAFV